MVASFDAIAFPFTITLSVETTFVPKEAIVPLTDTFPASMSLSASLREHIPVSLMYLLRRMLVLVAIIFVLME